MRPGSRAERGVVLVMVLAVVAVINVLVLDLNSNMFVVQRATHVGDRRTIAYYNAQSAVHLGRLALVLQGMINGQVGAATQAGGAASAGAGQLDMTPWASMLFDFFANPASRNSLLQDFAGIPSDLVSGFATLDGDFAVTIVDEDGRIDLNLAAQGDESQQFLDRVLSWLIAPMEYDDLFTKAGADGQITTRDEFVADAIDWADTNDQMYQRAGASRGAEDNSYQSLTPPYVRKDCPYDSLEELRRVRGVGEDFWATFVEPDRADPDSRTLTVWGQGKINVNDAPPRVLAAVICALAMNQQACDPRDFGKVLLLVDAVREATGGRFPSPGHFARAVAMGTEDVPGIPIDGSLADKWLTTIGKVYSLYIEGRAPVGGRPAGPAMRSAGKVSAEQVAEDEQRTAQQATAAARAQPAAGADAGAAAAAGTAGGSTTTQQQDERDVVVRLQVVIDTTSPWDTQGGRILYWREL